MTELPPECRILESDVGTWDAELEIHPGPGTEVQRSSGTSVARLIADGRWLVVDFKNATTGFEGHGVYGWDVIKQKYVGVWVDPMRPVLVTLEGSWDAAARTMTYVGAIARSDGTRVSWREITEKPDPDTQIFRQVFPGPDGSDFEMMRVVYRRLR